MIRFAFAFVAIGLTAFPAYADGPFGISMGTPISELKGCSPIIPGKWRCDTVPRPHSTFANYIVQAHPSTGVCWIKALTGEIASNDFGSQLTSRFDEVAAQLDEVYGKGESMSALMPGSIWKEPREWMMALAKGDRYHARKWAAGSGVELKNNIKTIYLGIVARSTSMGLIALEYAFQNEAECEKAIKAEEKGAL